MANPLTMHIPEILRGYEGDLAEALTVAVPQTWDDTDKFVVADQAEAIAKVIRGPIHHRVRNAKIAFVFRKSIRSRDREVWGKAGRADPKVKFFANYDFVLEFNWEAWLGLSQMQRIALVDHELEHLEREEEDGGASKYVLRSHDVEEFGSIVHRWGLWKKDLLPFADAIAHAHQLSMFDGGLD